MDPYERLTAINEALQEAMKPVPQLRMGKPSQDPSMKRRVDQGEKQTADSRMSGVVKTMAAGEDLTFRHFQPRTDSGRAAQAKRVSATATQSEVGDTARALKKRGGIIGGTKTGRRLAIVGKRVASRLGLTPKADAAAKKKALNRRINKKGELRKDIDRGVGLSKLGF